MHTISSLRAELDLVNQMIKEGQAELAEWRKLPGQLPEVQEARYNLSMAVIRAKRAQASLIAQIAHKQADINALETRADQIREQGLDHYPDY